MVPIGAEFLHVREQFDIPSVWYLADPEAPMSSRMILVTGTGFVINENIEKYLGSAHTHNGHYVWHAFLLKEQGT